jgi:hypothetical protein
MIIVRLRKGIEFGHKIVPPCQIQINYGLVGDRV